ncbi:MAG: chaperone NapD [Chromatiales bacterium]|jgi:nitrate reductase NapD
MSDEYNICGVLVMTRPEKGAVVEQVLNQIEGVEVHGGAEVGKLIVTVESTHSRQCADTITDMSGIDGVVSTSLVYHELDSSEPPQQAAITSGQEKTQ